MTYFSQEAKRNTTGLVRQAGFNWLKHQVEWQEIQTGPDQYNWAELDSIVDTAAGDQLNIILTVVHAPGFLRSGSSGLFPSNPDTYESVHAHHSQSVCGAGRRATSCGTSRTCRARPGAGTSIRRTTCRC